MWKELSAVQRVAIVAGVAVVALWTAVLVSPSDNVPGESRDEPAPASATATQLPQSRPAQAPQSVAPAPTAQPAAEPADHVTHAAPAAAAAARPVNESALAAFREGMASGSPATQIEALRQLEKDGTLEALPELLQADLTRDPDIAPTLIQVTSQLAKRSPLRERGAAAEQMSSWLKSEGAREDAAARGNVSLLVESLSGLNSPKTQGALIEVLQSDKLTLNLQKQAVDGLSHFNNPESKLALQKFREQLASGQREDSALQREAELATDQALARVSR